MKTMTLNLPLSPVPGAITEEAIRANVARKDAKEAALNAGLERGMRECVAIGDFDTYSDLHKDRYGIRPERRPFDLESEAVIFERAVQEVYGTDQIWFGR